MPLAATPPAIADAARTEHHRWLLECTPIPTAAGRERRVIEWIERWVAERGHLALERDPAGNLVIRPSSPPKLRTKDARPVYITAHLDHPAFVVSRVLGPQTLELSFRGGVMDDYFVGTRVRVHPEDDAPVEGEILEQLASDGGADKRFVVELDGPCPGAMDAIATWALPTATIDDGILRTPACDDLAALVAALATMDEIIKRQERGEATEDVRLLFTRAEEIGFIGAIGACRHGTIPENARVIALENSRAFADAPIGGGPIVRVGDRLSIFSPALTGAINKRAEEIAGGSAPTASQKHSDAPAWKWQRKLMAGGACEASVFCANGLEATCVCLPLGNYHNMADLDLVQAGANTNKPTIDREFIAISDFDGMVDLLVACGEHLPAAGGLADRLEKLWKDRKGLLDER